MALKVLALNCTLKAGSEPSSTGKLLENCSRRSANTMPRATSSA
jgi:hypothetical protein